jgi:hypothetical protein
MIVSIHIPRTAGMSFRNRLESTFGSRMLSDYGDWRESATPEFTTPEAAARRARRAAEMRARRDELLRDYDVIHGHFTADKYVGLFPATDFVAFFRDPCQHAMSTHQALLRYRGPDHPAVNAARAAKMNVIDMIAAFPDHQSSYLGRIPVEDLAVAGLTEHYERSGALFGAVFGRPLAADSPRTNVNPLRPSIGYEIDPAVRRAIDQHRPADAELYRRACEVFARQTERYGV